MKSNNIVKPVGDGDENAFAIFCRSVWDRVFGGDFPIKGKGSTTVSYSDGYYVVSSEPQRVLPAASVADFQLVSDGGDYYNCYTFDGVTAGTEIIKVAKHQDIRCILPSADPAGGAWATKTIRGVIYTYTYTQSAAATVDGVDVVEYTRSVSGDDSSSEIDYITPPLIVGDIITAFPTSFAGPETLTDVHWQAEADGRAWAALPA